MEKLLQIVDHYTADLAYDAGFPQRTETCYLNGVFYKHPPVDLEPNDEIISAPLQEELKAWIREHFSINIVVDCVIGNKWCYYKTDLKSHNESKILAGEKTAYVGTFYSSYEKALEAAEQQILKEQIKMIDNYATRKF